MENFISDEEFESMPEEETFISDADFESIPEEQPTKTSPIEAGLAGVSSGATMGLDDELYGGIKAIGSTLGLADDQSSIMDDKSSFVQNYLAGREERRSYKDITKKEHPKTYTGSEIGGAIASTVVAPAKSLFKRAAGEGALYGFGESEAEMSGIMELDMDEMEIKDALIDTGIGVGLGVGTAGLVKGGGALAKKGYQKAFGKSTKDIAVDAAGDILELTPKQRADAAKDIVKMGPGKTSTVAEELPAYLKDPKTGGGFTQNIGQIKKQSGKALDDAGKKIEKVLTEYEDMINPAKQTDEIKKVYSEFLGESNKLDFSKVAQEVFDDLKLAEKAGVEGYQAQVNKALKYLEQLEGKGTMRSIKDVHSYRKNVDKLIKSFQGIGKTSAGDALYQDALLKTRRKLANHLQDTMLSGKKQLDVLAQRKMLPTSEINKLRRLQHEIYNANRNYKLANFVESQIDQSIGRRDARKLFGLTDWILGAQAIHSPWVAPALAAKKAGEFVRPRAQLYAEKLGEGTMGKVLGAGDTLAKGVGKATEAVAGVGRPAIIQQAAKSKVTQKEEGTTWGENVKGTKYQSLFLGEDPQKDAVNHKVLMGTDEEYRKLHLNKED